MKRSRICFVSTLEGYRWGGSEELWSRTALRLRNQNCDVIASVKGWAGPHPNLDRLKAAGVHVKERSSGTLAKVRRKILRHDPWKWLGQLKPDLVVLSDGAIEVNTDLAERRRRHGIPYIVLFQAACEHWWPSDDIVNHVKPYLDGAKAVCCVSEANFDLVKTMYGTSLPHGRVIRNPFNIRFDANPAWPGNSGKRSLACVGRLDCAAKGQDVLFRCLASDKWRGGEIEVILYGDGPNANGLKTMATNLNLRNVVFGGFENDIEKLWSRHHMLIMPSRFEGLPLTIVEAMICSRPSIVTNCGGNAELLEEGATGFIAEFPVEAALDKAMERAWSARDRWEAMGREAAAQVRRRIPQDPIQEFSTLVLNWAGIG